VGVKEQLHYVETGRKALPQSVKSSEDHQGFKNKLRYLSTVIDKISFNQSAIIYTKDLTNYKYF